jgi:metal-responsive CopG/Arc/MetJ family transcriptional regulator
MAKILLSVPDEMLKRIDEYKGKKKIKRSQFFLNAVKSYFMILQKEEYFDKREKAVERMKETNKQIRSLAGKDWDPVEEIRIFRESHADALIKRWKDN